MVMAKKRPARPGKPKPGGKPNPWPDKLRAIRRKYGSGGKPLTQAQAAERLGVNIHTWTAWEVDRRTPSAMAARLINLTFPM